MKKAVFSTIFIAGILSVFLVVGCSGAKEQNPVPSTTESATSTAEGEQLYQSNCASCHGADGVGGIQIGDEISPSLRYAPLNEMYEGDWSLVRRAIVEGKDEDGEELDSVMPRWTSLSDTELNAIIEHLQTLK